MVQDTHNQPISFDNTEIAFRGKTNADLKRAYWLFRLMANRVLVGIGTPVTRFALRVGLPVTGIIRQTIYRHFCGGETIAECEQAIQHLAKQHANTILDYSVEGEGSEMSFEHTCSEILQTISYAGNHRNIPFSVFKPSGLGRFALLEKMNRGEALSAGEAAEYDRIRERINRICKAGHDAGIKVLIDAEHSWIQQAVDDIARDMMLRYNMKQPVVYNTFQLYRKDKLSALKAEYAFAKTAGFFLGAKLVRGAYMELERDRAEEMGYPSPIQPNKEATDSDYNEALFFCLEHLDDVGLVVGTHNELSCQLLTTEIDRRKLPRNHPHLCFAQLFGMSDNLTFNLAAAGFRTAKYMPYGPVKAVMPYLFRRAAENTAVVGQVSAQRMLITRELERRRKIGE